jgi:hypothetical protein
MNKKISTLAVAALFSLATVSANAASYYFDEIYNLVSYQENVPQGDHWSDYLNFDINAGSPGTQDSVDYSSSIALGTTHWWQGSTSYSFTASTKTGDTLFGNYTYTSDINDGSWRIRTASSEYTGGTGLFSGATGTGSFMVYQDALKPTSYGFLFSNANITTAPVPEADTLAMLLMGAGVMGFMARRRKNTQA